MAEKRSRENVTIKYESVVLYGKEGDPRFNELYLHMQARFGNREYGYGVCLHEAAHAVLMEQDGVKNVRFVGPEITYDPSNDVFLPAAGKAEGDVEPMRPVTKERMFQKCVHSAAGGVALRVFRIAVHENDSGDGNDYRQCWMRYEALRLQAGRETLEESLEEFWKRAQEAASLRLDDPDTRAKVLKKAEEYLMNLYPARD